MSSVNAVLGRVALFKVKKGSSWRMVGSKSDKLFSAGCTHSTRLHPAYVFLKFAPPGTISSTSFGSVSHSGFSALKYSPVPGRLTGVSKAPQPSAWPSGTHLASNSHLRSRDNSSLTLHIPTKQSFIRDPEKCRLASLNGSSTRARASTGRPRRSPGH